MIGAGVALLGLALLIGQFVFLNGTAEQRALMVTIGLPGVGVLASAGAISFAVGCLMIAAPRAAVRHAGRIAGVVRGRPPVRKASEQPKDWQVAPSRWPAASPVGTPPPEEPSDP
jgi:hypothetical protein